MPGPRSRPCGDSLSAASRPPWPQLPIQPSGSSCTRPYATGWPPWRDRSCEGSLAGGTRPMAARPVTAVRWSHLVLHGFGRFAGTVSLEFGPGLNVLVAPNEAGKSTLLAGLAAVLFGLPATTDPDKFGHGRWRNWQGSPQIGRAHV